MTHGSKDADGAFSDNNEGVQEQASCLVLVCLKGPND